LHGFVANSTLKFLKEIQVLRSVVVFSSHQDVDEVIVHFVCLPWWMSFLVQIVLE